MTRLSENFTLAEANCRCGCRMPATVRANAEIVAEHLEAVRVAFGVPIRIKSWYRCPDRNAKIGGAKASLHLTGLAVDLNIGGLSGPQIASRLEQLIKDERIPDGGIGVYANIPQLCHFDLRTVLGKKPARWSHGGGNE